MRKLISLLAGAAFVAALAMPVLASDMTVKGEVVDVACSTSKKDAGNHPMTQSPRHGDPGNHPMTQSPRHGDPGKGEGHADCAMVCAKKGQPVGILTADAVYTVVGDYAANSNAKLLDFVARSVIVTGEVTEKDGVKSINVKSIKLAN